MVTVEAGLEAGVELLIHFKFLPSVLLLLLRICSTALNQNPQSSLKVLDVAHGALIGKERSSSLPKLFV